MMSIIYKVLGEHNTHTYNIYIYIIIYILYIYTWTYLLGDPYISYTYCLLPVNLNMIYFNDIVDVHHILSYIIYYHIPVVPHKAVAEVSKIGNL